jgi:uncharacterized protein YcbK (DUF882 family)
LGGPAAVWRASAARAFEMCFGFAMARWLALALVRAGGLSSASSPAYASPAADSVFSRLPALRFSNENDDQSLSVRLYDDSGHIDELEATRLDVLLCDTRDPKAPAALALDRRTLQLAVRAALHFRALEVRVVSAYRKPGRRREGLHATGKAIDFRLPGVSARVLAAYLRTLPRVGVGIYTHPKTSYVHLDDREHSFHWLDASPPGRTWREISLGGGTSLIKRDEAYARADDWPEGTSPPLDAIQ